MNVIQCLRFTYCKNRRKVVRFGSARERDEAFQRALARVPTQRKLGPVLFEYGYVDGDSGSKDFKLTVKAAEFNGKALTFDNGFKCDNCAFTAEEEVFVAARDLDQRIDIGGPFTNLECPCCAALAYPLSMDEAALRTDCGEGGADYTLKPEAIGVWIAIGDISVYLKRESEGVVVDLYAKGCEMEGAISSAYGFNTEARGVIEAQGAAASKRPSRKTRTGGARQRPRAVAESRGALAGS